MRVLLDMNLSPDWVEYLARHGFDALHWSRVGDPCAPDSTIMEWARANGCVVFSHDLDYSAILAATHSDGPSVVQVRAKNVMPDAIGHDVVRVLRLRAEEIEQGAVVTIDRGRARVRLLPLGRPPHPPDEREP